NLPLLSSSNHQLALGIFSTAVLLARSIRVDKCGLMTIRRHELCTKLLICGLAASIVLFVGAFRRKTSQNSNNNTGSASAATDPEQARQQAQSLVDQGKELYRNDQDEQALATFKRAIALDANNADAHLWLGRAYGALEQKVDADESYRKAIEL